MALSTVLWDAGRAMWLTLVVNLATRTPLALITAPEAEHSLRARAYDAIAVVEHDLAVLEALTASGTHPDHQFKGHS